MQRDSLTNQSLKTIMAELRSKGVTTVSLLWQGKDWLLTSNRHLFTSNTVNLLRRVVRARGLAFVKLQYATSWTGKKNATLLTFNRSASEFYKLTKPEEDWTKEINMKWGLKDKRNTWYRRWKLIWHPQIHPKDAIFICRMLWQGLYTAIKALRFGFGDGCCPVCKLRRENIDHLFLACPNLRKFWTAMQKEKLLPFGSNLHIFARSLPTFIDDALGLMPASVAKWKVIIELWMHFWMNRNKLVYEGMSCDTSLWLFVRLALDKCILNWWDENKQDANNFAL
ncbi:hypothetical protein R1flu_010309 [Riccia fluitans]|uniref:Reverse transcriptase zinc-binding domain-containing protein n=1 Tax=Riccia fluitans TaxID=41844 RepID=A0ABD1Z8U3_9MARC